MDDEGLRRGLQWSQLEQVQAEEEEMQRALALSEQEYALQQMSRLTVGQEKGVSMNGKQKILVYCHPRDPKLSTSPHWFTAVFREEALGYDDADVYWVDPSAVEHPNAFREDGFSDTFLSRFENTFDHVFVPDCSGPWYHKPTETVALIESVSSVLKPGGKMIFGKLVVSQLTPDQIVSEINTGSKGLAAELFVHEYKPSARMAKIMKINEDIDAGLRAKDASYETRRRMIVNELMTDPAAGHTILRVTKAAQRGGGSAWSVNAIALLAVAVLGAVL